jgi:hypothetical protein
MSNSVRERLESEQRSHQEPEAPASAMGRGSPLTVATHQPSTRQRAEALEWEAAGPEILPKLGPRAEQMSSSHVATMTSVRSRLDQQLAVEQAKSECPTRTANSQYWLDAHEAEQRKIAARVAERDREMRERIARDKAIEASNARALVVGLCFDQFDATPAERRRILALPGAADASPETLVSQLLEVRELHAFAESCNDAEAEARRKK